MCTAAQFNHFPCGWLDAIPLSLMVPGVVLLHLSLMVMQVMVHFMIRFLIRVAILPSLAWI